MGYLFDMQRNNQMRQAQRWLAAAGLMLAAVSLQAVPVEQLKENYQSIIERNPFGLKPPPAPPTNGVPEAPKPKVEVFLTGITSIGYPRIPKQAYFYTREQGKKEITYYTMTEGVEKDGIEVLDIDHEQRKVRVKMENRETMLSFDTHGVPVPAVAAGRGVVAGVPGALPMPGQPNPGVRPLPMPGAPAATVTYDANGQPVYHQQPNYNPRAQLGNQYDSAIQGNTGIRQIPSRRIRGGNTYGAPQPPAMNGGAGMGVQQDQPGDPAEEYLRAHLNRAARQQNGANGVPIPPVPTME